MLFYLELSLSANIYEKVNSCWFKTTTNNSFLSLFYFVGHFVFVKYYINRRSTYIDWHLSYVPKKFQFRFITKFLFFWQVSLNFYHWSFIKLYLRYLTSSKITKEVAKGTFLISIMWPKQFWWCFLTMWNLISKVDYSQIQ